MNDNKNQDVYGDYRISDQQSTYISDVNQDEQNYYDQSFDDSSKKQNKFKVLLLVLGILIIVSLGGFALVYTGVVKVNYVIPKSMLLDKGNVSIKPGKDYQYDYQVYPENSSNKNVYYESSDPKILEVNEITGYVTAKKEGVAHVIVKSAEDSTVVETSKVVVTKEIIPIEKIILSSEKLVFDLAKSDYKMLKVTTEPHNATNNKLDFYSSDESVAIVDRNGNVTPVGYGMAVITVSTKDGKVKAHCEVVVTNSTTQQVYFTTPDNKQIIYPYDIQLEFPFVKMKYGTERYVDFTLLPPDVTEDVITWISSDADVVSVKDGLLTAHRMGTATITAVTLNDLVATMMVDVTDEEVETTTIAFKDNLKVLQLNETYRLHVIYDAFATINDFKWESSNPAVVRVDQNGFITGLKPGKSNITVTTTKGLTATVPIEVLDIDVTADTLVVKSKITIDDGETYQLDVFDKQGDIQENLTYKTSNSKVVTVNEKGLLKGEGPGEATITISNTAGVTVDTKVIVKKVEPTRVIIKVESTEGDEYDRGDIIEVNTTVYPPNTSEEGLEFNSTDSSVVEVMNGILKIMGEGITYIQARVNDVISKNIKLGINYVKDINKYIVTVSETSTEESKTGLTNEEIEKLTSILPKISHTENCILLTEQYSGFKSDIKKIEYLIYDKGELDNYNIKDNKICYDTNVDTEISVKTKITFNNEEVLHSKTFYVTCYAPNKGEMSKNEMNESQQKEVDKNFVERKYRKQLVATECYSVSDFGLDNLNVEVDSTNLKKCEVDGTIGYLISKYNESYYIKFKYSDLESGKIIYETYEGTSILAEPIIKLIKDIEFDESVYGKKFGELGIIIKNATFFSGIKEKIVNIRYLDQNRQVIKEEDASFSEFGSIIIPNDERIKEIVINPIVGRNDDMTTTIFTIESEKAKNKCEIDYETEMVIDETSCSSGFCTTVIYKTSSCKVDDIKTEFKFDKNDCLNPTKSYVIDIVADTLNIILIRKEKNASCNVTLGVKTDEEESMHKKTIEFEKIDTRPKYTKLYILAANPIIRLPQKTTKITAKLFDEDNNVTYISSEDMDDKLNFKSANPSVATVDQKGNIIANKVGTTLITVTYKDNPNLVDYINFTVKERESYTCYLYDSYSCKNDYNLIGSFCYLNCSNVYETDEERESCYNDTPFEKASLADDTYFSGEEKIYGKARLGKYNCSVPCSDASSKVCTPIK